ncbi:lipocalin family protein [Salinibacterium sp.]|uniref:lipocalin family protein n=1 Tax=Salinibacterium sp. TaxID=1915057 RepID=UPI00286A346A|nr:lipocalin family protein [Salinibacterium sp.]
MKNIRRTIRRVTAVLGTLALLSTVAVAPAFASGDQAASTPRAVKPVASLDLQRYSGTWLQLAAIPARFTAQCVRDTRAEYTPLPDGLVKVINTCTVADGSVSTVEGRARVTGPTSNAQLEVTFAQANGQFLFQAAGAYWVIGLDQQSYSWAVVGDPTRTNGFVLSRAPELNARQIAGVVRAIVRNGFDPCKFVITATTGGVETNRPLCSV